MGHFATGVTVVTASGAGRPGRHDRQRGLLALARPAAAARLLRQRRAHAAASSRERGRFGVNVLAAGQEDLARLFASKVPEDEKFAGVQHTVHDGIPVSTARSPGSAARSSSSIPGGDHTIGIGAVTAAEAGRRAPSRWSGTAATYRMSDGPHRARRRAIVRQRRSPALLGGVAWLRGRRRRGRSGRCCAPARRCRARGASTAPSCCWTGQRPAAPAPDLRPDAARASRSSPSSCGSPRRRRSSTSAASRAAPTSRELPGRPSSARSSRAILRREMGVMAASALVVAALGLRARRAVL